MITKAELLSVRALRNRAERDATGRFVVEGWKGVMELVESNVEVVRIYVRSGLESPPGVFLPDSACEVSAKDMERMSQMKTPPGVLATARIPAFGAPPQAIAELPSSQIPLLVYCDQIADPGNLGTIIRTAAWFGFAGVITDRTGVDPWNAKCLQASMGAAMRLPIWTTDGPEWLSNWADALYALDAQGSPLDQISWSPGAIAIGSESHGLSPDVLACRPQIAAIPGAGQVESLNAAVAGSIAMYEIARGR